MGLDGEIRTPNLRLPKPARSSCATSRFGTDGGIRTRTDGVLSAVPLPLGYVSACVSCGGPRGSRTRNLLLAGELRFRLRHRPRRGGARAGIEPACRAYETPLIPDPPLRWGDRPDSNRLPPGPRSRRLDHFRPRPQSTRRDSNPRLPLCERGGLPLTYSSSCRCVGRRGVEPRRPAVSARCLPVWLTPLVLRGLGSARTSPCRVSTGRSTVRASRPRGFARVMRTGPAAGIEPAASRVRAERPSFRTSPAGWWSRPARSGRGLSIRVRCPCSSGPDAACAGPRPGRPGRP